MEHNLAAMEGNFTATEANIYWYGSKSVRNGTQSYCNGSKHAQVWKQICKEWKHSLQISSHYVFTILNSY